MSERGSPRIVPLFGAPASDVHRNALLDAARAQWDAFVRSDAAGEVCPVTSPTLAELAMAHLVMHRGIEASWDAFDASAFHAHLGARFPAMDEATRFMWVASMPMFLAFHARRGAVDPRTVDRAFDACDALDPGE